jgi:C4-dicarboxylate transporter DctM subunit
MTAPEKLWRQFNRLLDGMLCLVLVGLVAVTVLQVFFRYILDHALDWPEEVARWGFVWLVFLGIAIGQREQAHIAIGIIADTFIKRTRSQVAHHIFVTAIIATTCLWLIIHGLNLVPMGTNYTAALQLPFWFLYSAVPTGAALTLFFLLFQASPIISGKIGRLQHFAANVAGVALGGALFALINAGGADFILGGSVATVLASLSFGLILLGVPIGFALVFAVYASYAPVGDLMMLTVSQNLTGALDSFILLSVPFFILAAALMNIGGVTQRLIDLAQSLVGKFRGGLAYVNVLTNAMMAGVSGSSIADAAGTAKMLVPAMERQGFSREYSCALTAASSTMAHLVPPSLGLIVYGALAMTSVGDLFMAGVIPGLLVALCLFGAVFLTSRNMGALTPVRSMQVPPKVSVAFVRALPALALPVAIVGGLRLGAYTATEAGAMAALYALLIGVLVFREMKWGLFLTTLRVALIDTIVVMFVVAAATPVAWVLTTQQVPQSIAATIGGITETPLVLLLLLNLFLLVVGLFMDMIASMVILVPILMPIVTAAGIDPVHFGIIIVLNLVIGTITPPMGIVVYVAARIGEADATKVFAALLPFFLSLLLVLGIVTVFPQLSLLLPSLLNH